MIKNMCCGEILHTLKGIDTEVGEISKKSNQTGVLGTRRSLKPSTLIRQSCILESQHNFFCLRYIEKILLLLLECTTVES